MEAANSTSRARNTAQAHRIVRLLVVVVTLVLLGRTSYHVTLASEQFYRIARGAMQ